MLSTWLEAPAKGRLGGQIRAGMWSAVVVGTHPIETDQEVWLEILCDDLELGRFPAFWVENKGVNSFWHVPIPALPVNARLRYRAAARRLGGEPVYSLHQEVLVRPNLPNRSEPPMGSTNAPEGVIGNRHMTVRVDERGSTYDIFFPTVGLHSDVRPAAGDQPQSRTHFRAIVGGLAVENCLAWFSDRRYWEVYQRYQGATNLLVTDLSWRHGPIRITAVDFAPTGPNLPTTAGNITSPGQYLKRFRIQNEGDQSILTLFGLYVHAEVNGGIGEPLLSWIDAERMLVASNRGHGHANRKLARDATVEFALVFDDRGPVSCEAVGPNEALLLRPLEVPARGDAHVDLLVSGAFTGWKGDTGTFEHWLKPARQWYRKSDLDVVEQETSRAWDDFLEVVPTLRYPRPTYSAAMRRSSLAIALHADAEWGAIAGGFDRGIRAYSWPRDSIHVALAMARVGHPEITQSLIGWLDRIRLKYPPYRYWFEKYTIDGWPEWETPAVDQSALIPWAMERHYRATGDSDLVDLHWDMIEQAAGVCLGESGHPGLAWLEDLSLISSSGVWENRFGAYLLSNAATVAGLQAAARLAELTGRPALSKRWRTRADLILEKGIKTRALQSSSSPGLVDEETGRFLEGRRVGTMRGVWSEKCELSIDRSAGLDIGMIAPVVPFGLMEADDPVVRATAEAILQFNRVPKEPNTLTRWCQDPSRYDARLAPMEGTEQEPSSLATLWMARYLFKLGQSTGEGSAWTRGVALLDEILARLGPLGLVLRVGRRGEESGSRGQVAPGAWGLQASLIDTLMDLGGLSYDAPSRTLHLEPVLPPAWPQVGLTQHLACGEVSFRLERPGGGMSYQLQLDTNLGHPAKLKVGVTCPGLAAPEPWLAEPVSAPPSFDRRNRRLSWEVELPAGAASRSWRWG